MNSLCPTLLTINDIDPAQRFSVNIRNHTAKYGLNIFFFNNVICLHGVIHEVCFMKSGKAISAIHDIINCRECIFCRQIQIFPVNFNIRNAVWTGDVGELEFVSLLPGLQIIL